MASNPNFDKGLYQAPRGLPAGTPVAEDIEVILPGEEEEQRTEEPESDFYANLAEEIPETILTKIGNELLDGIKDDLLARQDWEKMYVEGVNLLGLKYEVRNEPWQGACGVFHPMITEAVIRFQADTVMETFPSSGPVKTTIIGKVTEDKEKAAKRVEDDLNWQIMENMPEFRPDHERMLWNLPSAGCAFKKVYDCPILGRQTSVFVPAEDVIIPYGTTDLLTCERVAHRMKKTKLEVDKLQLSGFWREVLIPEAAAEQATKIQEKKDKETGVQAVLDTRNTFYEVSVELDLKSYSQDSDGSNDDDDDDDRRTKPYIVTVLDKAGTVVALKRNWKEHDTKMAKRQHFVQYTYIPGYGAYGFGLFHLLGGYATSATSIIRQLVDAGTLSNLPGGLKSKGLRIKGDDQPIPPGEFRDVDVGSGTIRDNILPLPYKEPSATLFALLQNLVEEARRFAATNDLKVADMSGQTPVGTALAVLERQLRTMTAVQARVHFSFKQELRLLADIIRDSADENYSYETDAPQGRMARLADYSYASIIPVSDPNAATMSQRVVQYQAVIQLASTAPDIYDQPELHRQMLTVLGIKNVGKLVPTDDDIKLVDPVQENQNILMGKPVKAWAWQDHESHLRVHMAAMQDPMIQQMVGQNPKAQMIMGAMTAHISDHVGHAYRVKMQQAMGVSLPALGKDDALPPEMEARLSKMMAQAAPQVLQQSQQMVAQQQAQKNAEDPVLQAQLKEQENNKEEIERKKRKDAVDADHEQQRINIEMQQKGIDPQQMQEQMNLERQKVADKAALEQQKAATQAGMDRERLYLEKERAASTAQIEQERAGSALQQGAQRHHMDMTAKGQQMRQAAEKHAQDVKLKEKQAAAARAAANKAPKKGGGK